MTTETDLLGRQVVRWTMPPVYRGQIIYYRAEPSSTEYVPALVDKISTNSNTICVWVGIHMQTSARNYKDYVLHEEDPRLKDPALVAKIFRTRETGIWCHAPWDRAMVKRVEELEMRIRDLEGMARAGK